MKRCEAIRENAINRRTFMHLSAAGLLGFPLLAEGKVLQTTKLGKIALQLYTVRREIEQDLEGTLRRVAEIGYRNVETAFWPEHISLKQATRALAGTDLQVCSIHCEIPVGTERREFVKLSEAYECDTLIWHGWPEDPKYSSENGIEELADIYNEAMHFAADNGLKFGLHNHWWEFRNNIDGKYPYQVLLPLLDERIFFELDTYWIKVAGLDPAEVVGEFAGRAPLLHIKDGPARYTDSLGADEPEPMTAVGQGSQDFPSIVAAAKGNTQWMVVEMDKTSVDVFQALEESHKYLIDNKLAMV